MKFKKALKFLVPIFGVATLSVALPLTLTSCSIGVATLSVVIVKIIIQFNLQKTYQLLAMRQTLMVWS